METARTRFVVLDAMRGAAAASVMVFHAAPDLQPMGFAAVDFFFVLSGFVLAHAHGEELSRGAGRRAFALKRIIRLYPLYAIGTILGAISLFFVIGTGVAGWSRQILGIRLALALFWVPTPPASADMSLYPLDAPAWSLFFEYVANAVFLFSGDRKRFTACIVLLSAPLLVYAMRKWPTGGANVEDFVGGFPRVLFSFFLGVAIFRLWKAGYRFPFRIHPAFILVVLVAIYAVPHSLRYNELLVFIVQPLLIWIGASGDAPGRWNGAMTWMGAISYGLYVVHAPVLIAVAGALGDTDTLGGYLGVAPASLDVRGLGIGTSPWLLLSIAAPVAILLASVLTYRVDLPIRRWLSGKLLPVRATPSPEPV